MSASLRTPVASPVSTSTRRRQHPCERPLRPQCRRLWLTPRLCLLPHTLSAVTPTPLSETTEKNFSVDKYFELQEKKLELEAKQRAGAAKPDSPRTVFDGSSVLSTDGGISVDYEDGELKTRAARLPCRLSPSPRLGLAVLVKMIRTLPRRSFREVQVMQLEAFAVTSEQRDTTRTDDTVREPWMPSKKVIDDRYGAMVLPNEIPLYVDNQIVDDAEAASKHLEPTTNQRRDYYISLFHELRYWSSKKTSGRNRVPEWQALCRSWNQFVANFNNGPAAYRERIAFACERFMSAFMKVPRTRISLVQCPRAFIDRTAPLMFPASERETLPGTRLTVYLKTLRSYVLSLLARVSILVLCLSTTPRSSMVGFVRLHDFRNIRHQDVPGNLEGDPIVSNEYENEPDLGSSSDLYGLQSDPPRGESYRGQSYASVGGGGRSSFGHPQVDHSLQSLHVEALEGVQAAQIAELKQQLNFQRAYVVEAAQTI
ncbi:LOW QUALITY PROTEIN: hypothetical protein PHMEG_00020103 [Phytophthora megakarya]|uniref:Uncharacterized protein n=1 Tax=Phytophthora megakarya TaxID=4795 RepID=A0A225VPT3_9STRA|nr:LOW QUALITY PROTEIN: hypothetical protein PHMEG_00020103 [Phytophthora megakarya]